jgi:hypothetical protein
MTGHLEIAGTERMKIPELDALADVYVIKRDARMEASEEEHEAKEKLHEAMTRHGFKVGDSYPLTEGRECVLVAKDETVKVRKLKAAKDDDGEE